MSKILTFLLYPFYIVFQKTFMVDSYYIKIEPVWVNEDPGDEYSDMTTVYDLKLICIPWKPLNLFGYSFMVYDLNDGSRLWDYVYDTIYIKPIEDRISLIRTARYMRRNNVHGSIKIKDEEDVLKLVMELTKNKSKFF